jgi:hypothetical protein
LAAIADSLNQPVFVVGGEFATDVYQGGETGRLGEILSVIIDAILKTGITLGISAPGWCSSTIERPFG